MDPDGFGFDSSVNYLGDPCTQMNSLQFWSRPSHYHFRRNRRWCSLAVQSASKTVSGSRLTWDGAAGPGWTMKKEWLNEWTEEIETVMTNRAACVGAEGELPKWVQRWLSLRKRPEGGQWGTCAGKVPTLCRTSPGMSQRNILLCREFVWNLSFLCVVLARQCRKQRREQGIYEVLFVCFIDQPKQIRIIFHPKLHKQAAPSNNARHSQSCICFLGRPCYWI